MNDLFSRFYNEISFLPAAGNWILKLIEEYDLLLMYLHIIISATFPIFIGAHASLRCPSSANLPIKKSRDNGTENEDELDELDEELPEVQGLQPSDAIVFPILAGLVLGGLYFLIKYLDDPILLNRVLNWYFSAIGVLGVGKLAADSLNVMTSFIFPSVWSTKDKIFFVDSAISSQSICSPLSSGQTSAPRRHIQEITNPFPGFMSSIRFPVDITSKIWSCRALLTNSWIFRGYIKNFLHITKSVRFNDLFGYFIGVIVIIIYNISSRPWWLTNLIAFGFCYGTLQIMSPTTFWTGSLVLSALFIYDITMVFYTPMMVTVATSLDIPIKLVFPGPRKITSSGLGDANPPISQKGSMLGLGDVVLPGIMIAIALRFDLYLHYLRKQRLTQITQNSDKKTIIKPEYNEATGVWGERFWTSGSDPNLQHKIVANGSRFNKVYFWASTWAYIFSLLVTLLVMKIFKHAQPALLYLVPGVLTALWGTAWFRGEIALMWGYTEDKDQEIDVRTDTEKSQENSKSEAQDVVEKSENNSQVSATNLPINKKTLDQYAQNIFCFSLKAPTPKINREKATNSENCPEENLDSEGKL